MEGTPRGGTECTLGIRGGASLGNAPLNNDPKNGPRKCPTAQTSYKLVWECA